MRSPAPGALYVTSLLLVAHAAGCRDTRPGPAEAPARAVAISIVGTNDLHGQLARLPVLAGYIDNLRAQRPVLLLDAGDMFQGTLASNLNEGEAVIRAYNALGYAAAAIGNHDFDFGPLGVAVEPTDVAGGDARGALKARARQARFPFLAANLIDAARERPIDWDNVRSSTLVEVAGVPIGVVGVATEEMPWVVRPSQFAGLRVGGIAAAIEREAAALRRRGARVLVVLAHAGGRCQRHDDPNDLSACKTGDEIFRVANALPPGTVDVMLAGHKHGAIAHRVNGIAIASAYAYGRAFSRVDVTISADGRVTATELFPPQPLCAQPAPGTAPPAASEQCAPGSYAGAPVVADAAIAGLIAPYVAAADELSAEPLGVDSTDALRASQIAESPLGNLLVDLMLAARPDHDLAIQNGGALRRDLPAGEVTYGRLYESMSFDNRFATIELEARSLRHALADAFARSGDVVSVAGARIAATCDGGAVAVRLFDARGATVPDDRRLRVLTSDYLATGGDGLFDVDTLRAATVTFDGDAMIRDAMAAELRQRGGPLRVEDFFDRASPRVSYPAPPPLRCAAPTP